MTADDAPATTLLDALASTVDRCGAASALRWRTGTDWQNLSWQDYLNEALSVAAGLAALGIRRGEHVLLLVRNRPEFHVVDVACLMIGAVPVSVYNSPALDRLAYILGDCDAVACVVEDEVFAERVRGAAVRTGARPQLIGIDVTGTDVLPLQTLRQHGAMSLVDVLAAADPGDTATLLYTSGTSGNPKGVPLSHRNLLHATTALAARIGVPLAAMRQLSYLPMAHIGERLATHYTHLAAGSVVTCCPDIMAVDDYLAAVVPEFLFGAPRLWERLRTAILGDAGSTEPAALEEATRRRGLGELSVAITGSAPMPPHVHQFWLDRGVPLADCYGQTESSGVGTWDPHDIVIGTCGRPFDGMEVAITDGGEIAVRGPGVFAGYHNLPERIADVLDADGWYRSGDLGRLDGDGNLVVIGRLNEMLVPTSGHNVSPIGIESMLRQLPGVTNEVVLGHGRPYLAALLTVATPGPEAVATIDTGIAAINEGLPGAERVRAHRVLTDVWAMDSDVLTATGKLRRAGVLTRYADLIDDMYRPAR